MCPCFRGVAGKGPWGRADDPSRGVIRLDVFRTGSVRLPPTGSRPCGAGASPSFFAGVDPALDPRPSIPGVQPPGRVREVALCLAHPRTPGLIPGISAEAPRWRTPVRSGARPFSAVHAGDSPQTRERMTRAGDVQRRRGASLDPEGPWVVGVRNDGSRGSVPGGSNRGGFRPEPAFPNRCRAPSAVGSRRERRFKPSIARMSAIPRSVNPTNARSCVPIASITDM